MAEPYANVTISHKMHGDRRFDLLAQLAGWSRPEACWRMAELWSRCTALQTDRPPIEVIRIHLGLRGEQLLLDSMLGEQCTDGKIRVLGGGLTGGDTDRFSWYQPVRQQQREAGSKRARTAVRAAGGRFGRSNDGPAHGPATSSGTGSAGPATTSGSPATTSGHPASGFRISPEDQNSLSRTIPGDGGQPGSGQTGHHATQQGAATPGQGTSDQAAHVRAEHDPAAGNVAEPQLGPIGHRVERPPSPGPFVRAAPTLGAFAVTPAEPAADLPFNPDDARSRGRLAEATYRRVSDARIAMARELKLPDQLPFPAITPSTFSASYRELLARVREEGAAAPVVCDRVVENLIAQARETRDVEWLAEKAFAAGSWRTARAWIPTAKRPPKPVRDRNGRLEPPPAPRPEFPVTRADPTPEEREAARLLALEASRQLFGAAARAPPRPARQQSDDTDDEQPDTEEA